MDNKFDKVVTHLQTTGYVFQGSQIYGGLSNTWDYGPLGSELKNNLQQLWWKKFVSESPTNVGIDAAILMNPRVWEATGHVTTFNDPLIDCKECRGRFRADDLVKEQYPDKKLWIWTGYTFEDYVKNKEITKYADMIVDGRFIEELKDFNLKFRGSSNQRIWRKNKNNEWEIVE